MSDNPTVPVYFKWQQTSADPKQYNQQRVLLTPEVFVVVNVPLTSQYIHNSREMLEKSLGGQEKLSPILTPAGMVYCDNALVAAYNEARQAEKEELKQEVESDDIEWNEGAEFDAPDDSEFPVEELIDGDDEEDLDEIIWEN